MAGGGRPVAGAQPAPEVTLKTLFGKVWYEGYSQPAWVWQSTGGTDDFESKMSLTPLIFGTIKGTLYALLFAVPMALLAALYVSEFMHPSVKAYVKPVVEIMARCPASSWVSLPDSGWRPCSSPSCRALSDPPAASRGDPDRVLWLAPPASDVSRSIQDGNRSLPPDPVVVLGLWLAFALGGLCRLS